jgi:hypothetical protein
VLNWSSTAATWCTAGSGNPTLFRASPFESVLVAASTNSKSALDHRHWGEPITTVIIASTPTTDGSAIRVPPSSPGAHQCSADLLIAGPHEVDQRRQLGITVVGPVSVPEAATGRRPPS